MTLPVISLLEERLQTYDKKFELRPGTAYYELFIKPMELIVQPFQVELDTIKLNQSFRRIMELPDPNAHPEDAVDSLAGNVYVERITGGRAAGVGRAYFMEPVDFIFPKDALEFTSASGLIYRNSASVNISAVTMANYLDRELFYADVPIAAAELGDNYNLEETNMIIQVSDGRAVTATNPSPVVGGLSAETNIDLIERSKDSIAVRDMNTGKGFSAIMFDVFKDTLVEAQAIGFLDPEMQRDIVYNVHIGGKIDGYVRTTSIVTKTFDVVGLFIDSTRRLATTNFIFLEGVDWVSLRAPMVDASEHPLIVTSTAVSSSAIFYSYLDLSSPINLAIGSRLRITRDDIIREMVVSGLIPSTTYANEIVTRINSAFGSTIVKAATNPTIKLRTNTGICVAGSNRFYDPTDYSLQNINNGDILTIHDGVNAGQYTITGRNDDNTFQLSVLLAYDQLDVVYSVMRIGLYLKFTASSYIKVEDPVVGDSAILAIYGGLLPQTIMGISPTVYNELVGYEVDYTYGKIKRLPGPTIVTEINTGSAQTGIFFYDLVTPNAFSGVMANDILTVTSPVDPAIHLDFRIKEKISNTTLRLDRQVAFTATNVIYKIMRSEIMDNEQVNISFDYNPLSIDVGGLIPLDVYGRTRGVRPGRELQTITDMPLLDILQIELIDPVTKEPLDQILESRGGYGRGGYGMGGYGRGSSSEWSLRVLNPVTRFSMWEDSLIIIDPAYTAQSFRVTYRMCPMVATYQSFADSDLERVLDAHVLIKHFLPAYVNLEVYYTVDANNPNTPANEDIVLAVKSMINKIRVTTPLDMSDIVQTILSLTDPTKTNKARVKLPSTMQAVVHNTDGTKTILTSIDQLVIPSDTDTLTPRVAHWIADNVNLVRI